MEKNNLNTMIRSIVKKDDRVIVRAVTLSKSRADHKFVIEPSDVVPEEYWGMLLDNNEFEYVISL